MIDPTALDRYMAADRAYVAARTRHIDGLLDRINGLFSGADYKMHLIVNLKSCERLQALYSDAHNGQRAETIEQLMEWFGPLSLDEKLTLFERKRGCVLS